MGITVDTVRGRCKNALDRHESVGAKVRYNLEIVDFINDMNKEEVE